MPLYVDWSTINPPLTDHEREHWAFSVGITMLGCGMSALKTDADCQEMYTRVCVLGRLNGAPTFVNHRGEDVNTLELWYRWKGVTVNNSKKTRATWIKQQVELLWDSVDRSTLNEARRIQTAEVEAAVTAVGQELNDIQGR